MLLTPEIKVPGLSEVRPKAHGRRDRSPTCGFGAVINPDGTVEWQDSEWIPNLLSNAGEASMNSVYFAGTTTPSKYLALLNQGATTVTKAMGTMTAVTESQTPGSGGYARQLVNAGDWVDEGLQTTSDRYAAGAKTFGPFTGAITISHTALCTTSTGAGVLILTLAASAAFTLQSGQQYQYVVRNLIS